jgi:predicted transcriptional regulator
MQPLLQRQSNNATCYECVFVDLRIQHKMRIRYIVICGLYFSILSHKRDFFREKVIEYKMCVLIVSKTFVRNICYSEMK